MAYNTTGILGPGFTQTDTSAKHKLGTRVEGTDGTVWLYVLAGSAITQYQYVTINENHSAIPGTKAAVDDGHRVGFAQVAIASGSYGWVPIAGSNINVLLSASTVIDSDLWTGSAAGNLGAVSANQSKIKGVFNVAATTAAGANAEIIATWPHGDV